MKNYNTPLVTIITVTYNLIKNGRKKYLKQCIESVHYQTYKNIEHIVIDGGSTDGTVELLEHYKTLGWLTYISEKDNGIYDAMNKGIALAKGKYIAYLNSDDNYDNNSGISKSVESLIAKKADCSYAPANIFEHDGSKLLYFHHQTNPDIKNVFHIMPFCHQTMVTKKDVLLELGGFDKSFRSASDFDLILRLCLSGYKAVRVEGPFVTYRLGGLSDSNQDLSKAEMKKSFTKNYFKYCDITDKEASEIYQKTSVGIPLRLAKALKDNMYFDYEKYENDLEEFRAKNLHLETTTKEKLEELKIIHESRTWKIMKFMKLVYRLVTFKWIKK